MYVITAAVRTLIAIATMTNVLKVFVFGVTHSVGGLDELVAFCTSGIETTIVVELIVLGTIGRSGSN